MNDIYSQLTMPPSPTTTLTVSKCPPNSRYSASTNTCIPDDRPSPARREAGLAPSESVGIVRLPMMDGPAAPQMMGDAIGTVKNIGMGILNTLTLIGALGGLIYIWGNRRDFSLWSSRAYWQGRKESRRRR